MKPLPESFRKKGFPDGYNFEHMAKLVQDCSMRLYPELPTSHGFCMYIKREVLDEVGYFDEKTFGKGYGEENDFSFRCLNYGYKHIFCDDVYVMHVGAQSFLSKKKFHDDELKKKYPETMRTVEKWYQRQEIDNITDNVVLAIGVNEKRINVLVILHTGLTSRNIEVVNKLRKKYNIHVLGDKSGNYVLHSFFKDVDLDTAIYKKSVMTGKNAVDSKEFKKMKGEIIDIFGISVVVDKVDERQIIGECKNSGEERETHYLRARKKMLEYDFVQIILKGVEMKKADDEEKKQRKIELEQERREREDREWRENLTITQRIYLKIRYVLTGR